MQNAPGRAYIMGGRLCQDAQGNCGGNTASVDMLDMSLGAWQHFSVSLGAVADTLQTTLLDYALGALLATDCTVNYPFADERDCLPTTMAMTTTQGAPQACIAFVLDESGSIVTTTFQQVGF